MRRDAAVIRFSSMIGVSLLAGCGLLFDPAPPRARDAGRLDMDARTPDAGADPCDGMPDGAECLAMPGRICLSGVCVFSECGDGFVDEAGGEHCEPAADSACHPLTCRYECELDDDCASGTPCLLGKCIEHVCEYEVTDGECTLGGDPRGVCLEGACVAEGCGDGRRAGSEECDRGSSGLPGCIACQYECHDDTECGDGDACNGEETCVDVADVAGVVGRTCAPSPTLPVCASRACFAAMCVTEDGSPACIERLLESDGDGFAPGLDCEDGVGGDCDDGDRDIHPGATEVCNDRDDDCDGATDEETGIVAWCPDHDGDGFGDPSGRVESCEPPGPPFVRDCTDCYDSVDPSRRDVAVLVHPGQTGYFATAYCPEGARDCSFDFDCDGDDEIEIGRTARCEGLVRLGCNSTQGWVETVPGCGEVGTYVTCRGVGPLLCNGDESERRQRCR